MMTLVALFTRAWIEIHIQFEICEDSLSPSLRGRGLKLSISGVSSFIEKSPSLRGRGLKFGHIKLIDSFGSSPSLRGRGLKCFSAFLGSDPTSSPSLRGRGLKFGYLCLPVTLDGVALFTRAWIEI